MTKKQTFGLLAALTAAAASLLTLARGTFTADISAPPTATPTAASPSVPPQCAYVWAYHDLPEISAELQAAVQAILPEASAHATAFGEDCIGADGGAVYFAAMETDFYIRIPVTDLNDDAALGNLIAQLLPVILDRFPLEHLQGPKEGFVEFAFFSGENQRVLRVPIPLAMELRGKGLNGTELVNAIQTP